MLPIYEALPSLTAALREGARAVLVAPPGAGKTTVVPLTLLAEPWAASGRLIVLEPRRLAARAAAARMAQTLGEPLGATVGFRVRMQSKVSARTRIEVVTEGVFTRMILDDPGLEGVAGVLLDEFHERSLDADLGLALALDAQALLRPDLRLLVMSATLDGTHVAALLDGAPVIESAGRAWPVETRHLGRDPAARLEEQVARAVLRALSDDMGSVLAFLPGQGEIRRVETLLAERLRERPGVLIAPLYGALDPATQDRAIAPAPAGVRKVVLATSIAETSLTIEGVRVVVDCGLARVPRFDPASGLTRLQTVRVSRAAADQRRGRAGRTEPGVCYRLWDEAETRGLTPFARPEMLEADLSGLALDLAAWGAKSADGLRFLDPPPVGAFAEARGLLAQLGALDAAGELTAQGRALARLPLPPRLAHLVLWGAARGAAGLAAQVAALLGERGLGGTGVDMVERLERFTRDASPRARDARALAARWARLAGPATPRDVEPPGVGALLAAAFPERVAQARGGAGTFRLASGRGVALDPAERLARAPWLAVGELGGGGALDRVLLAAELTALEIEAMFAAEIVTETAVAADPAGRVQARRTRRLGRLILETRTVDADPAEITAALLDRVRTEGLVVLRLSDEAQALRARVAFVRGLDPDGPGGNAWPDLSDAGLLASVDDWLPPALAGRASLAQLEPAALTAALTDGLSREQRRALDRLAPERLATPAGSSSAIDYAADGGPRVEVKVQALFGLTRHPTVADGRVPLTLALLSPAGRPVQTTRDLAGFWAGSWREVRTEMRGRYPRHPWPEDPAAAPPTLRAKPRGT